MTAPLPVPTLKRCPFCGVIPDADQISGTAYDDDADGRWVLCGSCGAEGPAGIDKVSAIEAWNSRLSERGPDSAILARLAFLWRGRAEAMERLKLPEAAERYRTCAEELESVLRGTEQKE